MFYLVMYYFNVALCFMYMHIFLFLFPLPNTFMNRVYLIIHPLPLYNITPLSRFIFINNPNRKLRMDQSEFFLAAEQHSTLLWRIECLKCFLAFKMQRFSVKFNKQFVGRNYIEWTISTIHRYSSLLQCSPTQSKTKKNVLHLSYTNYSYKLQAFIIPIIHINFKHLIKNCLFTGIIIFIIFYKPYISYISYNQSNYFIVVYYIFLYNKVFNLF